MATKTNFTSEEWGRLLASPMVTGLAITAADPGGVWSLLKEGMTGGWALLEAHRNVGANALVKAVAEDFTTAEGRTVARASMQERFKAGDFNAIKAAALAELRAVSEILEAKAPEDAAPFKGWLQDIAQKAAEAGKEGGFLGFGGVAVSDAEKATIAEISTALGRG
jgi:hypothetical protein